MSDETLREAVGRLVGDWQANGNSAPLGDPRADVWHKAARQLRDLLAEHPATPTEPMHVPGPCYARESCTPENTWDHWTPAVPVAGDAGEGLTDAERSWGIARGHGATVYAEHDVERIVADRERKAAERALLEAADNWPREVNTETIRRELACPNPRDIPKPYTTADWLRDRAGRIGGTP